MKAKNAADIFNQMIEEGKIEDVFDIIIKLKENNVTQILKFLSGGFITLELLLQNLPQQFLFCFLYP